MGPIDHAVAGVFEFLAFGLVPFARIPLEPRLPLVVRDPPVVTLAIGLPLEPVGLRFLGEEILFLESHRESKPPGVVTDKEDVLRVFHHGLGHEGRGRDALQAAHRARSFRRPMHAACIELDDAFLIRQPTEPH
jgi:hypothetical protein